MTETYVTPGAAAERLGVTPRTVARWADVLTEGVHYIRTPKGHRRIALSVVNAWAEGTEVLAVAA
jgi:hypothetical protein